MNLFGDTAAILNSLVSNSYYEMPTFPIDKYLPPTHPIIAI